MPNDYRLFINHEALRSATRSLSVETIGRLILVAHAMGLSGGQMNPEAIQSVCKFDGPDAWIRCELIAHCFRLSSVEATGKQRGSNGEAPGKK